MPARRQAIIWTNAGLFYLRVYVSLGIDESIHQSKSSFHWQFLSINLGFHVCTEITTLPCSSNESFTWYFLISWHLALAQWQAKSFGNKHKQRCFAIVSMLAFISSQRRDGLSDCGLVIIKAVYLSYLKYMMTSSKGNIFPRYCPFVWRINRSPVNSPSKASDAGPWCFLWSAPK